VAAVALRVYNTAMTKRVVGLPSVQTDYSIQAALMVRVKPCS